MGTWKVSGIVPDSDDESQEDSQPNDEPIASRASHDEIGGSSDIWSVPQSSPALGGRHRPTSSHPHSQPVDTDSRGNFLHPHPDVESDDEIDLVHEDPGDSPDLESSPFPATPTTVRTKHTDRPNITFAQEPDSSPLSTLSSISSVSGFSVVAARDSPPTEIPVSESTHSKPSNSLPLFLDSPPHFRLGFVRSLRPRKPIQQHPYLLENARYTQVMKSHGVKPVRTAYNSAQNETTGGDSQEQEFADEALHDANQLNSAPAEDTQSELQSSPPGDSGYGRKLFPGTSTPTRQPLTGNGESGEDQTDNPSLLDDNGFPLSPRVIAQLHRQRLHNMNLTRESAKMVRKRLKPTSPTPHAKPPSTKRVFIHVELSSLSSHHSSGFQAEARRSMSPSAIEALPLVLPMDDWAENLLGSEHMDDALSLESPAVSSGEDPKEDASEPEATLRRGRRIPASWLMLDQRRIFSNSEQASAAPAPRRAGINVDQAHRRGVALPRRHSPGTATPEFMFDESDEDVEIADGARNVSQTELWQEDSPHASGGGNDETNNARHDFDDTDSVVEEDFIDRMAPGTKRRTQKSVATMKKKRRTQTSGIFTSASRQKTKQPKITSVMGRVHSPVSSTRSSRHAQKTHSMSRPSTGQRRSLPHTPMLSILDVVEPKAPDFIRIAARTARSREKLGKTSPSQKSINLGNRNDNLDALSVLRDWKSGKLKPRIDATAKSAEWTGKRPLQDVSLNSSRLTLQRPKKISTWHPSTPYDGNITSVVSLSTQGTEDRSRTIRLRKNRPWAREAVSRPAQLETVTEGRAARAYFVSKKKELDEMYRRRRKVTPCLPTVHLERLIDASTSGTGNECNDDLGTHEPISQDPGSAQKQNGQRDFQPHQSRFRKRYTPILVDPMAPRFTHALDHIPQGLETIADTEVVEIAHRIPDKLLGLGPFGSQYSQHFDVFPLDGGVFFNRNTLLGSGRLSLAIETGADDDQRPFTTSASFQLDGRSLTWDAWNDNVSSEFGILLDWLADILCPNRHTLGIQTGTRVSEAVDFMLDFIQRVIAARETPDETRQLFALRGLDALISFADRLETTTGLPKMQAMDPMTKHSLAALSGTLLVAVWILRVCRDLPTCLTESFRAEELLKRIAKMSIKILLKCGLGNVRAAYEALQQTAVRGGGIRGDKQILVSWVILMQILGYARLPRAGFWDVTYSVMLDGLSVKSCIDAGPLERMWQDMFTLLPLFEIGSSGAIQPGLRHLVSFDGWALPREILSRVFQMYVANPNQSSSFNAYCHALVGRCHFLVEEWGWQHCSSIIGVIFDFYGRQGFAHLRNEEACASPGFLEELADSPSLSVAADDKCFHIFIKMLGLVILRLRNLGLANELRNLIARTLPNHNRQYLKEQDIHSRDLAALRNHHDLLCTLFWAAPPELRPGVHLIEKLVVPGSSHKEACLINIRAWNQLARFVVATGADPSVYNEFVSWMNSITQQVLEQYLSAESDIQRQFLSLSESMMKGISPHILKAMAAKNKATSGDVLYACVTASLDVLKHAKSLEVATYCFSRIQLEFIFTKIGVQSPESDWSILRTALDIVAHFIDRLEKAMDEQYSSSLDAADAQATEDAILMLDHKLAKSLFHLSNSATKITLADIRLLPSSPLVVFAERCVVLSARLVSRFIHAGMHRLSHFFGSGSYSLFERLPHTPGLAQRKFLALFLASMIQNNVFDFKDIGGGILELWMLELVKPEQYMGYEIRLAETLKRHGLPYLRKTVLPINGQAPSYDTNLAFFSSTLSWMRLSFREADDAKRRQFRGEFSRVLKQVMQQMKEDLKYIAADTPQQERYVGFVRSIVGLIKSYGGDICPLDAFYYQQSHDYSPSPEDPQLQTAGIIAYGLRLGDGEATAAPQLFHYLHNSFNIALANNRLSQECEILERSMGNDEVLRFMLERLLPASIRATSDMWDAWPMLAVYCSTLHSCLSRWCVPKDIGDTNMAAAVGVMSEILAWLRATSAEVAGTQDRPGSSLGADVGGTRALSCAQVHIMAQLAALANALQPVLLTCSYLACSRNARRGLDRVVRGFHGFATKASALLERRAGGDDGGEEGGVALSVLLGSGEDGILAGTPSDADSTGWPGQHKEAQVDMFRRMIVRHVRENWVVSNRQISVRRPGARPGTIGNGSGDATASNGSATAVPLGTAYGPWMMTELLDELQRQVSGWKLEPDRPVTGIRRLFRNWQRL